MIAVPERELGDGIVARARAVHEIRRSLDSLGFYQPLHLLGCGNATKSRWVKWEVEKSLELGKRVVAVYPGDLPPKRLPSFIARNEIKIVPWTDLAKELAD